MLATAPSTPPLDQLLGAPQVAEALGARGYSVHVVTVWRWIDSGKLRSWRLNRLRLTTMEAVEQFLSNRNKEV